MEFLGTLHDLEAAAAGEHAATVLGENGRDAIGVFLVLGGINDARTCDPIGGHIHSPIHANGAPRLDLKAATHKVYADRANSAKFACGLC